MENRRKACRLPTDVRRAAVALVINGKQHPATMVDISATGFAVLLSLEVPVAAMQVIKLTTSDASFECEVAYVQTEKRLQKLGLRRVRDTPSESLPKSISERNYFQETLATLQPGIFLGIFLGMTTFVICGVILYDIDDVFKQSSDWVNTNVRDLEEMAANERRRASTPDAQAQMDAALQQVLAKKQKAASVLTGRSTFEWQSVAQQLKLSVDQETKILAMIEDATSNTKSADAVRLRAMAVLTQDQRSRFVRLVATRSQ